MGEEPTTKPTVEISSDSQDPTKNLQTTGVEPYFIAPPEKPVTITVRFEEPEEIMIIKVLGNPVKFTLLTQETPDDEYRPYPKVHLSNNWNFGSVTF